MKRRFLFSLLACSLTITAQGQNTPEKDYCQSETVVIWNNTTAPHSNYLSGEETLDAPNKIGNVTCAEMYIFAAEPSCATGQAVVICPGGGYSMVALRHEGLEIARMLAQKGITASVLKYRMPNANKEVPLEDALRAIELMRERSDKYGFSTDSVGIMGSSAGGHLAATASNLAPKGAAPDFTVLLYPVISSEADATHSGSFKLLLGENATESQKREYSMDRRVSESTPPTFIVLSDDDKTVPAKSSLYYYTALKEHGIPASMHIYPTGAHGWGMSESFRYASEWQSALIEWLYQL